MSEEIKEFKNEEEATKWMEEKVNDPCIDNHRFAFKMDKKALENYKAKQDRGCCGFFDEEIKVDGKEATIGCNYGH